MRCPKCQKFIPSSARKCPGCGIEIISGASPNYGQDFVRQSDAAAARHGRIVSEYGIQKPRAVFQLTVFTDDEAHSAAAKNTGAAGFGAKLKSLFGFGK